MIMRVRVIGVVKDFNFGTLHRQIEPILFFHLPRINRFLSLKLHPETIHETMIKLQEIWKEIYSNAPFEYFWADERVIQGEDSADCPPGDFFGMFPPSKDVSGCQKNAPGFFRAFWFPSW